MRAFLVRDTSNIQWLTAFDDVFDEDDVPAPNILREADELPDAAGGCGSAVRSYFDERDFAVERDVTQQFAHEHERSVEHADEQRRSFFPVVAVDACGHLRDGLLQLFAGDRTPECLVVKPYRVHLFRFDR